MTRHAIYPCATWPTRLENRIDAFRHDWRQVWMFACVSWCLAGCVPRPESSVVIYCSSDREYSKPILDSFGRHTVGTEVTPQFDVESSKTLGLVTRIEQEKDRPRCDVFWNNEIMHTIRLQKQGLLQSRQWKIPDDWPKEYRAKDGSWIGFAARARVLLINKSKMADSSAWPQSVMDLSNARWKNRCGMAYPVYGTTATHMAVLATYSKNWEEWIEIVSANAVILAGNKQVALAVSRGELDWGLTDTDDAIIELESGQPVEVLFPDQMEGGFGTLFIPNAVAVLRGAPHPTAASALADFLVSEKIEARLAMGNGAQFPVWPNSSEQPRLLKDKKIRWATVDFEKASENWKNTLEKLQQYFQK